MVGLYLTHETCIVNSTKDGFVERELSARCKVRVMYSKVLNKSSDITFAHFLKKIAFAILHGPSTFVFTLPVFLPDPSLFCFCFTQSNFCFIAFMLKIKFFRGAGFC